MMGKKVLVTGAATGFGRGVAWALSERGHQVIAGCQIWPQVWELRNAVLSAGIEMQVIKLDVLNEVDRKHALAIEIDVLFNNAGIMESGPIIEIPMSVFRSVCSGDGPARLWADRLDVVGGRLSQSAFRWSVCRLQARGRRHLLGNAR